MYVLTQDRDEMIEVNADLLVLPVIVKGKLYAANLTCRGHLLGTFDSPSEAATEMHRILTCTDDLYAVRGYSDYDFDEEEADVDEMADAAM